MSAAPSPLQAELQAIQAQVLLRFLAWLSQGGATLVNELGEPIEAPGRRRLVAELLKETQ